MAKSRFVCLFLAIVLAASTQTKRTVDELVDFVKSAIDEKQDDGTIASAVHHIALSNKLDNSRISELQQFGAGPKTVAALHRLGKASARLPAAAVAPVHISPDLPPPPGAPQMKQILNDVRENALSYTRNLPDYVCTEATNRRVGATKSGKWRLIDEIVEQLTFFDQKENYKLTMVNKQPVKDDLAREKMGGATSSGEFGSDLHAIFAPESETEFTWDRWSMLRSRWAYVFSFQTRQPIYSITDGKSKRTVRTKAHGSVLADRDSKMVVRIELEADGIPADFPIQSVSLDLNYDFIDIGGQVFLLPLRSDVRSRQGRNLWWNESSYVSYHKFGADSSISFDAKDVPDEKPKEEPPAQDTSPRKEKHY